MKVVFSFGMDMNANKNVAGMQPLPGYTLRTRLGVGGYGEVWLAEAPGGLQKAVKLVHGNSDESRAATELRSLERIREVSHPFLLSIERVEIVDHQVIIITELAETSLLERYEQCRRNGDPGIPRTTLLDFLHDGATGLDYLSQKHSLQHLDVKPGNLLIVADRVKVADFGLIKDLHDQSLSLVSGLTPTYSAPEIFDGRPDQRSDQYSLAIVYMEMLTGHLPFNGKTTGELTRQHLSQQPDLEALPPADRPVVARALSKNPLDRFSSCRQFIEQLQKVRGAVIPEIYTAKQKVVTSPETNEPQSTSVTQCFEREYLPSLPVDDLPPRYMTSRSLFVGIGGIGCQALEELRKSLMQNRDSHLTANDHGWLAIDTSADPIEHLTDESNPFRLPPGNAVQIPIFTPQDYRGADPKLLKPISRRWLYNIPKSLRTEGVRPLAVLAMLDHFESLKQKLEVQLKELIEKHAKDPKPEQPLRIYLMASTHGGTGSGLICELANLLRRVASQLSFSNYRICAITSIATSRNSSDVSMPVAVALACLSEMTQLMSSDFCCPPLYYKENSRSPGRPFDWVTLVDGGIHGSSSDVGNTARRLADVALVDSQTVLSEALAEPRLNAAVSSFGWLRTSFAYPLDLSDKFNTQILSKGCAQHILSRVRDYLLSQKNGNTNADVDRVHDSNPTHDSTPSTEVASEKCKLRILRHLGLRKREAGLSDLTPGELVDKKISFWTQRLSSNPLVVDHQLMTDLEHWRSIIASIIEMRRYRWKQIEQIQLNVIEGIIDFCDRDAESLQQQLTPFAGLLESPEQLRLAVIQYLKLFAEECLKLLAHLTNEGKVFAKKLDGWYGSLTTERELQQQTWSGQTDRLPADIQLMVSRVESVLETAIYRELLDILQDAVRSLQLGSQRRSRLVRENLTLQNLLTMAGDCIKSCAEELGIDMLRLDGSSNRSKPRPLRLQDISSFGASLAQDGSKIFRFAIVPSEYSEELIDSLHKQGLLNTTTVLPCNPGLGAFMVCDGVHRGFSKALANMLRPSAQTLQLSERLRTRVDIDWMPVNALFDIVDEAATFQAVSNIAAHIERGADVAERPTQGLIEEASLPTIHMPDVSSLPGATADA